ncbi:MAG: nucleotidyltransferase family protein [bacterium]
MSDPVRQAVLLAAGRGSRLGSLTHAFPKPLLAVGGITILARILEGVAAAGITRVAIVTGHEAEQLERAIGDGNHWGVAIEYVRQPNLAGTAKALLLTKHLLDDEPFLMGWGDIVVDAGNYRSVAHAFEAGTIVLGVNEVVDPFAGGAVYVDEAWNVERLVEKPAPGTSMTHWNNAGLMILPPSVWTHVEALEPSSRGEYELPQAVAAAVASGTKAKAVPIEGPWFDIGTVESLQAARAYFES